MTKAKVGLITVSLPRERIDLARTWNRVAQEELEKAGLEILWRDEPIVTVEETVETAKSFFHNGAASIVYLLGTWIYVPQVVRSVQSVRLPTIVWSPRDPASFSLTAGGIVHGSLDEMGLNHMFLYGSPTNKHVIQEIRQYAQAASAVARMRGQRLGLIGGRVPGMYTTMVDMAQVMSVFHVDIEHVDQHRVVLEAEDAPSSLVDETIAKITHEFGTIHAPSDMVSRSVRLYHAVRKIAEQDRFDALAVKCQDELINTYVSYCLAVSLLNDDGIVTACECDLNAALTMYMLHLLTGQAVVFADVNDIDLDEGILRLVNCGSLPSSLAVSRQDVDLGIQYEYLGKKQGCTTIFCCKPGRVTLARLSRISGTYHMLIAKGQAFYQPKERFKEVRDAWPHAFVSLECDMEKLIQNLRSNHMHMVYGAVEKEVARMCEQLGIQTMVL